MPPRVQSRNAATSSASRSATSNMASTSWRCAKSRAGSTSPICRNQPDYVRGVLNLRGVMVPIVDLRCRFGQGDTETTPLHVVIIVQIDGRQVGLLADRVLDIVSFEPSASPAGAEASPMACAPTSFRPCLDRRRHAGAGRSAQSSVGSDRGWPAGRARNQICGGVTE